MKITILKEIILKIIINKENNTIIGKGYEISKENNISIGNLIYDKDTNLY